jgi:hypothetical protein
MNTTNPVTGYYSTPNSNIPLNSRPPGEIADIAWQQLKPFRDAASTWPVFQDGPANRCRLCNQNIWFAYDVNGNPYVYGGDEVITLIVAHIRQVHSEVVTNDGTEERTPVLGDPGNDSPGDVSPGNASGPGNQESDTSGVSEAESGDRKRE